MCIDSNKPEAGLDVGPFTDGSEYWPSIGTLHTNLGTPQILQHPKMNYSLHQQLTRPSRTPSIIQLTTHLTGLTPKRTFPHHDARPKIHFHRSFLSGRKLQERPGTRVVAWREGTIHLSRHMHTGCDGVAKELRESELRELRATRRRSVAATVQAGS